MSTPTISCHIKDTETANIPTSHTRKADSRARICVVKDYLNKNLTLKQGICIPFIRRGKCANTDLCLPVGVLQLSVKQH